MNEPGESTVNEPDREMVHAAETTGEFAAGEFAAGELAVGESAPAEFAPVELVRESRARFGIATLFVVTAVLSVQFALISYWGMVGATVAVGVWMAALTAVAVYGEYCRYRGRLKGINFERRVSSVAVPYVGLLLVVSLLVAAGQVSYERFSEWRLKSRVETALGYKARKQLMFFDSKLEHVWTIYYVQAGGVFDQAGVSMGDHICSELAPFEFLQMLDENQGSQIDLTLTRMGALGQPPGKWPQRTVTVNVPPGAGAVALE